VLEGCSQSNPTLTRGTKYTFVDDIRKYMYGRNTERTRESAVYESSTQREHIMSSTIDLAYDMSEPIQLKSLHRSDEVVHNSTLSHRLRSRTDSRQASLMVTDR
jgi:hypothetical protein